MIYKLPTTIYDGTNCIAEHADVFCKCGAKALIVTGRNSSKINGSLDDVIKALDKQDIQWVVYDKVEENPSVETVYDASILGMRQKVDFVIGIGGGSPIDAAKAIAILIAEASTAISEGIIRDVQFDWALELLYAQDIKVNNLPVVAVPTTCGTGSEATGVSVLTLHSKKTKASLPHRVFPDYSFVDGKYLKYAPFDVITATAIDALGHIIESYVNTNCNDYVRMFVDAGLSVWSRSLDVLLGKRQPEAEDYANLMTASTLAGMCIAHAGTTIPHSLSYSVTYRYHIVHGLAIGHFLPGYIKYADKASREYILTRSGFVDSQGIPSMKMFEEFIAMYCGFGDIDEEIKSQIINSVLHNKDKLKLCPYELNYEILNDMW